MTTLTIRYRVKPQHAERHVQLLRAVYRELAAVAPSNLRWSTFRFDDGLTFLDLVETDEPGQLSQLTTWRAFRGELDSRCEQPPEIAQLEPVAAYPER